MNKKLLIFIIALILVVIIFAGIKMIGNTVKEENTITSDTVIKGITKIKLETNKGDIVIELYKEMPVTAGNFESLVKAGFYNGVTFHRIIDGFMIQGGDPTGTGMGGPGYTIKDEFTGTDLDRNDKYTISMANAGPDTGGSQFFINLVDNNFLDGKHPVFGKVIEGMDVVDAIAKVEKDAQDKPSEDVVIKRAGIMWT